MIKPGSCPGTALLKNDGEIEQKKSEFVFRKFGFGKQVVTIDELLEEINRPRCAKIAKIRIKVRNDAIDQLVSIIPFVSQWTIQLRWDYVD